MCLATTENEDPTVRTFEPFRFEKIGGLNIDSFASIFRATDVVAAVLTPRSILAATLVAAVLIGLVCASVGVQPAQPASLRGVAHSVEVPVSSGVARVPSLQLPSTRANSAAALVDLARNGGERSAPIPASSTLKAYANATPTSGYAPLTVAFSGSASGGTPPYYYSWQFIGTAIPGQYVNQTFTEEESYPVTLIVGDSADNLAEANITINVMALPFSVSPSASPSGGFAPITINFSANPTGGSDPFSWDWYVNGSENPITTQNFTETFSSAAVYPVELWAVASGGRQFFTAWCNVTLNSTLPLESSLAVSPLSGPLPFTVTARGTASNAYPPYNYSWTMGDGTDAYGPTIVHTFDQPGSYVVTLTVTDSMGHTSVGSVTVLAYAALAGTARAFPATPQVGEEVEFSGTVSGGVAPFSFAWSFGDGTRQVGQNATHAYSAAGNYSVVYCINDSVGEMACGAHWLVVLAPASSGTILGLSPIEGYAVIGGAGAVIAVGVVVALIVRRRRRPPPVSTVKPA